jgi:hypothetical protein
MSHLNLRFLSLFLCLNIETFLFNMSVLVREKENKEDLVSLEGDAGEVVIWTGIRAVDHANGG